jgi:hypothetical protein
MTVEAFTYEEFENVRKDLIEIILKNLSNKDKDFLLSVKKVLPDWSIYDFQRFPSINWKLQNLQKLKNKNTEKHKMQNELLKTILGR